MKIKIHKKRKDNDESRVCKILPIIFFCLLIVNLSPILATIFGVPHSTVSLLMKTLIGLICVINVRILFSRFHAVLLIAPICTALVYIFGYLLFRDTVSYLKDTIISFITLCIPLIMYGAIVRDFDQLKRNFVKVAYYETILTLAVVIVWRDSFSVYFAGGQYAMGLGYAYVVPVLFLIYSYISEKRIQSLICGCVLLFTILAYGSRGPLLGIAAFGLIYLLRYLIMNKKHLEVIGIAALLLIFLLYFQPLLSLIAYISSTLFGIESRTIELLVKDFGFLSNREIYYDALINEINLHPFSIRGINAEYLLINDYAHNFILQLVYEFGVVFGGLAVAYIFWCVMKTIVADHRRTENVICLIFMCASVPSLCVSGTLWYNQSFWIWFTLYHFSVRRAKQRRYISLK